MNMESANICRLHCNGSHAMPQGDLSQSRRDFLKLAAAGIGVFSQGHLFGSAAVPRSEISVRLTSESARFAAQPSIPWQFAGGLCHGVDARGGQGPDLLRSPLVLDDDNGELIGPVIQNGRPSKGMPAFVSLPEEQVRAVAEFLHMQVELAANRGTYQVQNIVTGNAQAGEAYFKGEGKCYTCHSGSVDLAHIGSKLAPADLQAAELYPEARSNEFAARPPRQVTVTLASGKRLSGSLKHLDDFYVSLEDAQGQYHSIAIAQGVKAVVEDKLVFHRQMLDRYTDKQIHDLTAYLVTLK